MKDIIIGLIACSILGLIIKAVIVIAPNKKEQSEEYKIGYAAGYRDAKQIYESQDFEYQEEKLLND